MSPGVVGRVLRGGGCGAVPVASRWRPVTFRRGPPKWNAVAVFNIDNTDKTHTRAHRPLLCVSRAPDDDRPRGIPTQRHSHSQSQRIPTQFVLAELRCRPRSRTTRWRRRLLCPAPSTAVRRPRSSRSRCRSELAAAARLTGQRLPLSASQPASRRLAGSNEHAATAAGTTPEPGCCCLASPLGQTDHRPSPPDGSRWARLTHRGRARHAGAPGVAWPRQGVPAPVQVQPRVGAASGDGLPQPQPRPAV
jgi:hypothetical protein